MARNPKYAARLAISIIKMDKTTGFRSGDDDDDAGADDDEDDAASMAETTK